ncbi:dihydroorotase [[Eubacterium] cellulosolvens]
MPENWIIDNLKVIADDSLIPAAIEIDSGKIKRIAKPSLMPRKKQVMDGMGLIALPGLIDTHVHMRDLELSYKEDFYTGTCAAAAGGFTTVIDMPNTQPPTDSPPNLRKKIQSAQEKTIIDIAFHCLPPVNTEMIDELITLGAKSFKLYLNEIPFEDYLHLGLPDLLAKCRLYNTPLTIHAEDSQTIEAEKEKLDNGRIRSIEDFIQIHSPQAEARCIEKIVKLTSINKIHLCHLSSQQSLKILNKSKSPLTITKEVTPHHLFLNVEHLFRFQGEGLTNPPLRSKENQAALWGALNSGDIQIIATDHAPHTLEEKNRSIAEEIPPGIPGLETCLPLLLTKANQGYIALKDIVRLLAENPAKIFNIQNKGHLKEGFDADIVLIDLKKKHQIEPEKFFSKARYSPFAQYHCKGNVTMTINRGEIVYEHGEIIRNKGKGKVLR